MKSWKSRKFVVFAVSAVLACLNTALGGLVSEVVVDQVATLVAAWLIGQGIADSGGGAIIAQSIAQRQLVEERNAKAGSLTE